MTILEGRGVRGNQGLKKDQLEYLELMRDLKLRAYKLVRQEDKLKKAKRFGQECETGFHCASSAQI